MYLLVAGWLEGAQAWKPEWSMLYTCDTETDEGISRSNTCLICLKFRILKALREEYSVSVPCSTCWVAFTQ